MSARKNRVLASRLSFLQTEEAMKNWLGLWSVLDSIPDDETTDMMVMDIDHCQPMPRRRRPRKASKLKQVLAFALLLLLYILANSIAPTAWTPNGMAIG